MPLSRPGSIPFRGTGISTLSPDKGRLHKAAQGRQSHFAHLPRPIRPESQNAPEPPQPNKT